MQTLIEQIGLVKVVLEISRTSKDDTSHIDLVGGDKVLHSQFSDLADVVVTLFVSQTGETQSGLTTTTVLLGQVDREFLNNVSGISTQSSEKGTATVHDNETEFLVGLEQLA